MALSKEFLVSLNDVIIKNHRSLARKLIRDALNRRTATAYLGNGPKAPAWLITEEDFKSNIPAKHYGRMAKIVTEMGLYLHLSELILNRSESCPMEISPKGIDFAQEHWSTRHPIWFGTLLGGGISFFSGLFLSLIKHFFLTKA